MKEMQNIPKYHGISDTTMPALLESRAYNHPKKEVYIDYSFGIDKRIAITATQMNDNANKVGNALLDLGIKRSDHISWLENDYYWVLFLVYGCSKTGIVHCPLNYRFIGSEIEMQVKHSDSVAIIVGEEYIETVNQVKDQLPVKHFIAITPKEKTPQGYLNFWELMENGSSESPEKRIGEMQSTDLASLAYTAGTTGMPKGVMHTHASTLAWGSLALWNAGFHCSEKAYYPGPLFHWGGHGVVGGTLLLVGCTWVHSGAKFDPLRACQAIGKEGCRQVILPPAFLHAVFQIPGWEKILKPENVIAYLTSGGPTIAPDIKIFLEKFPNATFGYMYAATEGLFTETSRSTIEKDPSASNVGLPLPQVSVSIRDMDDIEKEVPHGEKGMLYMRGPSAHSGYYNNPEITKKCVDSKGFMTVEELGYINPDTGCVYFIDRQKDMICSGSENVASIEVDEALMSHPAVLEAATIGIPDASWGEKVIAVVSLKPEMEATGEEIIKFCRTKIAGYKVPKEIKFMDELPKNPFGKLMKRELRDPYWEGKEAERLWGKK